MGLIDNDSASTKVASGTEAQRPGSPSVGMIRFNTDANVLEAWDGSAWVSLGAADPISATGGTETYYFDAGGSVVYKIHSFTNATGDSFTINSLSPKAEFNEIDYAVIGGGGGGGGGQNINATSQAGYSGECIEVTDSTSFTETSYAITVGGAGYRGSSCNAGYAGGDSSIAGIAFANGGRAGACVSYPGCCRSPNGSYTGNGTTTPTTKLTIRGTTENIGVGGAGCRPGPGQCAGQSGTQGVVVVRYPIAELV